MLPSMPEHIAVAGPGAHGTGLAAPGGVLVFLLGTTLRVALALVNREASDDHLTVIEAMVKENRIVGREEAFEGFQPKLYAAVVAGIGKLLPNPSRPNLNRAGQLVNCAAGVLTMLVAVRFLQRMGVSPKGRLLAFSFIALNPALIGVSGQATNDAFVILFASLALAQAYLYFRDGRGGNLLAMTLGAVLASLSKGNGLVVPAVILPVWAVGLIRPWPGMLPRRALFVHVAFFLAVFLGVVTWLGPYWTHFRRYGSPLVINMEPPAFPKLLEETPVRRPGVRSVADAFLTFRLLDMLAEPMINDRPAGFPAHRTSFWSQVYGRSHFLHFEAWPTTWRWRHPLLLALGRTSLVLGLWPTGLLVAGLLRSLGSAWCRLSGDRRGERIASGGLLVTLAAWGYLAFGVVYALRYRDFSTMKPIFMFPGLLGFAAVFAGQYDRFRSRFRGHSAVLAISDALCLLLLVCYVADVESLIIRLRWSY